LLSAARVERKGQGDVKMNKEDNVEAEIDEETVHIIDFGCEKLNITREQLLEEALKGLAQKHGYQIKVLFQIQPWISLFCVYDFYNEFVRSYYTR